VYLPRSIEKTLDKVRKTFPAIVITGPRQAGKSTLLLEYLGKIGSYIALDNPQFRQLLADNPLDYLREQKPPVFIDEIQYFPELASYVKILIDERRDPGRWFITGSQQFSVMRNVSESLAGRAAVLALPTFTLSERKATYSDADFLLSSSYPELVVNPSIDNAIWYSSYLQTYLERDIRANMNISNIREFEQFIRLLAGRTGQELNMSALSRDIGVSVPTVKKWISALESSYIVFLVPPYYKNYRKRIIKSPKLYFYDLGLVTYLMGISSPAVLMNGPLAGPIFETAVISEIIKTLYARGTKPELYFWRSQSGIEIDLLAAVNGVMSPIEIKFSTSIKPLFFKNLQQWLTMDGAAHKGYLITRCEEKPPLPRHIEHHHWSQAPKLFED
jgi:predicted AAA+ superfamily ATPase